MDLLWRLDENVCVQILTFWWNWWNKRNKIREGELPITDDELIRRVQCSTLEFMQLFRTSKKKQAESKWAPPGEGILKINVDGAYTPGETFAAWGAVVRDEAGDVLLARAGRKEQINDPFGAEVAAMSEAVAMAADIGALRVVFETDSQLLQEALDLSKVDSSPYAAVIEDIKLQLKLWFSKQSITFCRRAANSVGHELAKLGSLCLPNDSIGWTNIVPPHVAACVSGDLPEHR
ncbi:uncharacterized protein [Aegilops tauschii subsp. strangulata]|uniref:uncharacterized protein n=1 Tax=Aegilops tauschii subsp. strangulata TaxID=200361 RepID=UPI003CC8A2DA